MNEPDFTIYEYNFLKIGDKSESGKIFSQKHLDALDKWNTSKGNKKKPFFEFHPNSVKFAQYVGILQVGNISIEILPKIDENTENLSNANNTKDIWRRRLCEMLRVTKELPFYSTPNASQNTRALPLWDILLKQYIQYVNQLVKGGLIKAYRKEKANRTALKGKLMVSKQITVNCAHKEKFFTEATIYDRNALPNRILVQALRVITHIDSVSFEAKSLLSNLEDINAIDSRTIDWTRIEQLKTQRKTASYSDALSLARMILEGTSTDFNTGGTSVMGILFDMNKLFEQYVAKIIARHYQNDFTVKLQDSVNFWDGFDCAHTIRPDIVIYNKSDKKPALILDTKWKDVINDHVSDGDLAQMFAYCSVFGNIDTFIVYPKPENANSVIDQSIPDPLVQLKTGIDNIKGLSWYSKYDKASFPFGCGGLFFDFQEASKTDQKSNFLFVIKKL